MNKDYLEYIINLLKKLENIQDKIIDQVADICAECIYNGGLLYFFGTGHSHMIAEEPFYRAGGLACVYPILETDLMLHEGASKSSGYGSKTTWRDYSGNYFDGSYNQSHIPSQQWFEPVPGM